MTLAGISYISLADVPGDFFRCSVLRSTLKVDACAANWRRAQSIRPTQVSCVHRCAQCPIGAKHAGEVHVERSSFYGGNICPSCGMDDSVPHDRSCRTAAALSLVEAEGGAADV